MMKKSAALLVRITGVLLLILIIYFGGRGLWDKWYTLQQVQAKPEFFFSETVLVDAAHPVPADYSPELVPSGDIFLTKAAAASWQRLTDAAEKNGVTITAVLGYCAPEKSPAVSEQTSSAPKSDCRVPALESEHCLGLAVDVSVNEAVQNWLEENMYKYGFILRYPAGKESVTGVAFQPQHLRFVGTEAAKKMTKKKLVLEEYLALLPSSQGSR